MKAITVNEAFKVLKGPSDEEVVSKIESLSDLIKAESAGIKVPENIRKPLVNKEINWELDFDWSYLDESGSDGGVEWRTMSWNDFGDISDEVSKIEIGNEICNIVQEKVWDDWRHSFDNLNYLDIRIHDEDYDTYVDFEELIGMSEEEFIGNYYKEE